MVNINIQILIRRLYRNKIFSLLNIAGLSIGIAISLLIFLIISYELSIDRFHKNRDRIYRVVSTETYRNGLVDYDGDVPMPLPDVFRREFPQPEKVAALWEMGQAEFTLAGADGKKFRTQDAYFAGPELFDIFDFPWIAGDPHTAINDPNTAAISRSTANAWFGNWQNALGKTILWGDQNRPIKINGILEDPPENTDISLKMVLSYATFRIINRDQMVDPLNWDNFNSSSQCFFLLPKNQRIESMQALLPDFVARHYTPLFANSDTRDSSYFQPFKQMHLDKALSRIGKEGWSKSQLWALGLIGIFILTMACINFINLSTAQSLNRGKEVGIRKVLGSNPGQLFISFIQETGFLVFLALLLAIALAYLTLSPLAQVLEKPISMKAFVSWPTALFLMVTGLLVTLMAGFYPGLVVSRFDPIAAIKSKINTNKKTGLTLRRSLIVLQFVIAQMLIIGTLIVLEQMEYFRNRPMGFDRKAIVMINLPYSKEGPLKNAYFKTKVTQIPGVLSASLCNQAPSSSQSSSSNFTYEDHVHPEDFEVAYRYADSDYLRTFQIKLAAGRYPYPSDTVRELLLNETVVKRLGFKSPSDVIGNYIHWGSLSSPRLPIVGVVRDFHNGSLKEKISPLFLVTASKNYYTLAVKLDPAGATGMVKKIQKIYNEEFPGQFFDQVFLEDSIVNFYNSEAIASKLFRIFTGLAIFISCLGLYGLVSFMAVQKTKEVGIRKVLGASIQNIVYIFSKEFTILIGIAFLIAAPLGYYFMSQWLSAFYYHLDPGMSVFAMAILLSIVIAWITVGYRAVRAAVANPVKSLRSE